MQEAIMYVDENNNPIPPPRGMATGVAPPMGINKSDKADLLEKIKPDIIVETIRQRLMGKELINGKWVQLPELKDRALTPKGAWDISNIMLGVSSQNVSLSKLDDKTIRERTLNLCKAVQRMCLRNWKEYGITGADQLDFVHQIVFSNSLVTLKQPEGAGIQNLIKGVIHQQINTNEEQKRSKMGLFRGKLV